MHFRKVVPVVTMAALAALACLPVPTQLWGQTPASALPQAPPGRPQRPARSQRNGGYPTYDEAAIERGKTQFVSTCGFCHGAMRKAAKAARICFGPCWCSTMRTATRSARWCSMAGPIKACRNSIIQPADFRHRRVSA